MDKNRVKNKINEAKRILAMAQAALTSALRSNNKDIKDEKIRRALSLLSGN